MANRSDESDFPKRMARIESLIQSIERSSDAGTRRDAQELVQAVLDLHGAGLARMFAILADAGQACTGLVGQLADDELVGNLLMLHELHPLDLQTRVERALDTVRPYLRSHGGEVELLSTADGVVRLRMQGSCNGCPSSALTLKHSIEEAILSAAPDAMRIEVEGVVEAPAAVPAGFVSVERLLNDNGHAASRCSEPKTVGLT